MATIKRFSKETCEIIRDDKIDGYIFGPDYEGGTVLRTLVLAGIDVAGFLCDQEDGKDFFHTLPVITLKQLKMVSKQAVVFIDEKHESIIRILGEYEDITVLVFSYEKNMLGNAWVEAIKSMPKIYEEMYEKCNKSYFKQITTVPKRTYQNGYYVMSDYESKYINIQNGERKTVGGRKPYKNTIYLLGQSFVYGYANEDKNTISSILQRDIDNILGGVFGS